MKAPRSISEWILFLLEAENVLVLVVAFAMTLLLAGWQSIFPLFTFVDPKDGDRWTVEVGWPGTCMLVLMDCVFGTELVPRLRRALKASRKDWFCKITSEVEKFVASFDVALWLFSIFPEEEANVEFENVCRDGEMLLFARLEGENILEIINLQASKSF